MSIFFHHSPRSGRGFTLIELLVVISIMLIFTTMLLLRQQKFDSSTLLRSLGYSVALSVRQAQVYGSSVRENASGKFQTDTAARSYGVHFTSSSNTYILFADGNNNGKYDSGEDVQPFQINKGYSVKNFCAVGNNDALFCSVGGTITWLDIVFTRPNPEACFATSASLTACASGGTGIYKSAYIQLIGPDGVTTRSVTVTQTGQIAVGAAGS